jgi:hypothetical protein
MPQSRTAAKAKPGESVPRSNALRAFAALGVVLVIYFFVSRAWHEEPVDLGELAPVRGVVLQSGKPIQLRPDDYAKVWFHPDSAKGNRSNEIATAEIGPDGAFELSTRGRPGAALGWYRVAVIANRTRDPRHPQQKRTPLIRPAFGDPNASGLSVHVVKEPKDSAYDLQLPK